MKLTNPELAFVLGRLLLGLNFLLHGLVRIPKLATFQAGVVKEFAASPLPPILVASFGHVLPFVEAGLGLLLLLGLFTRPALAATMLLIMSLVFGSSLLEKWSLVGDQTVYGLYIFALLLHVQHNRLCLDRVTAAPAA
ncbi:DoxX family membrane protein [Hymenobacter sp. HMF4947]|uniref:DoxX family membrane protein n=1 Tax=Hymenobacter ginkgonis TaxID=2682976 RepID=A0A7K1TIT3_9BACT|nr:DoxX family membrane protein [Hymenobacter ginkgonis]MVN78304.1 DoxX family membrane protein [Hymenobacter ginkgonis]